MTNSKIPKPEFSVDCAMCGTTFAATADTLKELVEIVQLHLKQVMEQNNEPHKEYLTSHPDVKQQWGSIEKKFTANPNEILSMPQFRWAILRLQPFNVVKKILPP